MEDQHFTREHRIRFRRQFLEIYQEGRRAHGRLAVVFCRPRPEGDPWRVGVTVTKKVSPRAVMRNRLRRRVREYFRRGGGAIPDGWDFVVNLKTVACKAGGRELWEDLERILRRLEIRSDGSDRADGSDRVR